MNDAFVEASTGKAVEPPHGGEILGESRLAKLRIAAPQIVADECCVRAHPSGQEATAQRAVAECRDLVFAAIRQQVGLDAAFEQVVGRLQHMQGRDTTELFHLFDREIAHPDGADLSLDEQCEHRLGGFLHRHQGIGPVDLVDVDVIGAQPPQRILDLAQDARAAGIAEHAAMLPFKSGLGGDDDARAQAALGDCLADDLLGTAEAVDRSRIDDIDAMLERRPDGGNRGGFVGSAPHPSADGPGAERDARHRKRRARNVGELHG